MKNQRNHTRHPRSLILTLAGLIAAGTLLLCQASLTFAQTAGPSWSYTGNLNTARYYANATLLPNGKVLVAGGYNTDVRGPLDSAELYDPATGQWSLTGRLNTSRAGASATLLQNGQVLIAGGSNRTGFVAHTTAELYDPATGKWTLTGNLNKTHWAHSATLLANGKVLIAGGFYQVNTQTGQFGPSNYAELYDPDTGTWSNTGNLSEARFAHTATLLQNGKVLVAGGDDLDGYFGNAVEGTVLTNELYDPNTGSWSITGSLNTGRGSHTATLLPNGSVLAAGGGGVSAGYDPIANTSAELYNPATGTWSYTASLSRRGAHTATLLANGQVLVSGGGNYESVLDSAEIYDPATGNWNGTANLNTGRGGHTATLLPNGRVLVVGGGDNANNSLRSAELYDPGVILTPNAIDDPQFFVRQHYLDFLNREPDAPGLTHWTSEITACNDSSQRQPGEALGPCIERKRANTSAAFFLSPEFQNTGSFVLRVYWGTLGKLPNAQCPTLPSGLSGHCRPQYANYVADMNQVAKGIVVNNQLDPEVINANKRAFLDGFVNKPEFKAAYDSLSNQQFVDKLFATTGIAPTDAERSTLVSALNAGAETRSSVVFKVVDGSQTLTDGVLFFNNSYGKAFYDQEFDAAFVFMEYAGYLHRNPDQAGYDHWLNKLKLYGNWQDAQMVMAFILSPEYRQRFGQP